MWKTRSRRIKRRRKKGSNSMKKKKLVRAETVNKGDTKSKSPKDIPIQN